MAAEVDQREVPVLLGRPRVSTCIGHAGRSLEAQQREVLWGLRFYT